MRTVIRLNSFASTAFTMARQPENTRSSRSLWGRRFLFGGLTASTFGIVAFVCLFVGAVRLGIEETDVNIAMLWTVIITLVAVLGGYGLILGIRNCESTLLRIVSIGIPISVSTAVLCAWVFTDLKLGIFIWGLVLLPSCGVIIICGFVASLVVSIWWQNAIGTDAG